MLIGPPHRPHMPEVPDEREGLQGIYDYLRRLDRALATNFSVIVGNSIGLAGLRGISGSGTVANNFVRQSLQIGNLTNFVCSLVNVESNASYLVFLQPSRTTGMVVTTHIQTTTSIMFGFEPAVPSGMTLNLMLVRS